MRQLSRVMVVLCATWLAAQPLASAQQPKDKPKPSNPPQKTSQPKAAPAGPKIVAADDDLFELHIRLRRAKGGLDLMLVSTVPSAEGAVAAADVANLLRDQGMVGLMLLPVLVKTNPDTHRALRSAMASFKAEAEGAKLKVTASIPHEAITAAAEALAATVRFATGLVGWQ